MMRAARTFDRALSLGEVQRRLAQMFAGPSFDKETLRTAMADARMLLCAALGIDHAAFVRDAEQPIGDKAQAIARLAARRAAFEPVSRILGRREFFGLDLAIGPAVLDPRADTETLVEAVLEATASRRDAPLRIVDLGTGSGAILCALLARTPHALGLGIDVSRAACRVAADNLAALDLSARGKIVCGHWTKPLNGSFDVIVSNPPYIARDDIGGLAPQVRDFDPRLALDGGEDGYDAYRAIIPALPGLLAPGGLVALEVGKGQAQHVAEMLDAAGFDAIATRHDLAGIARVISARRSGV